MNFSKFKLQKTIRAFYRFFGPDEAMQTCFRYIDMLFNKGRISMELRQWAIDLAVAYHELLEV